MERGGTRPPPHKASPGLGRMLEIDPNRKGTEKRRGKWGEGTPMGEEPRLLPLVQEEER